MELESAVAVVTGGAFGIGQATAVALAAAGADVVVADVFDDEGRTTVAEIEGLGRRGVYVSADVGSREAVERLVEHAIAWQGHCDLFVSNAAISGRGELHRFSPADWERMLAVNLFASIWAMRAVLPHMIERNQGHVAFVASAWGFQGSADDAPYAVSKWGLVGLAESVAAFLQGTAVGVSLIVPGAVGGPHADTLVMAGADDLTPAECERIKAERRELTRGWPQPASMAETIVAGLRAGRFYIIQEGSGHEDWLGRQMRQKWVDPEASIRGQRD